MTPHYLSRSLKRVSRVFDDALLVEFPEPGDPFLAWTFATLRASVPGGYCPEIKREIQTFGALPALTCTVKRSRDGQPDIFCKQSQLIGYPMLIPLGKLVHFHAFKRPTGRLDLTSAGLPRHIAPPHDVGRFCDHGRRGIVALRHQVDRCTAEFGILLTKSLRRACRRLPWRLSLNCRNISCAVDQKLRYANPSVHIVITHQQCSIVRGKPAQCRFKAAKRLHLILGSFAVLRIAPPSIRTTNSPHSQT